MGNTQGHNKDDYNFTDIQPSEKSCFHHFSTSACVRSSTLAILALCTAVIAFFQVVRLHIYRTTSKHHFAIHYTIILMCLLCTVNWLMTGDEWLDYAIAWLMVIQYLTVFHKYWSIGRIVLSKWRLYFSSLFIFLVVVAVLNTVILVADLLVRCIVPHCERLHYLSLSLSEFLLSILTMLVAVHICKRFLEVSMTHAMRATQKYELFLVAAGFLASATLCLAFDAAIFATESRDEVSVVDVDVKPKSEPRISPTNPPELYSSTLKMNNSAEHFHFELRCTEVFAFAEQPVYDVTFMIEMIIRYLVPNWFALIVIRPQKRAVRDDYEEIVSSSTYSDDSRQLNANTYASDYSPNAAYSQSSTYSQYSNAPSCTKETLRSHGRTSRERREDSGYSTFSPRNTLSPHFIDSTGESETEDPLNPEGFTRSFMPSSYASEARVQRNLVDDLREQHLSQRYSVDFSVPPNATASSEERQKKRRVQRSRTTSE